MKTRHFCFHSISYVVQLHFTNCKIIFWNYYFVNFEDNCLFTYFFYIYNPTYIKIERERDIYITLLSCKIFFLEDGKYCCTYLDLLYYCSFYSVRVFSFMVDWSECPPYIKNFSVYVSLPLVLSVMVPTHTPSLPILINFPC